ncbi:hypothetical protein ABT392_12155 [Paucibacter sp. JuS9]|uniref:hypothetical protein n=1 Tax=Roseateles TaxID=93681 RepID=UPI002FE5DBF8
MKSRRTLLAITTVLLSTILSGCIVLPGGHHHRHRDYGDHRGGYHGSYQGDRDGRHDRR